MSWFTSPVSSPVSSPSWAQAPSWAQTPSFLRPSGSSTQEKTDAVAKNTIVSSQPDRSGTPPPPPPPDITDGHSDPIPPAPLPDCAIM